MFVKYLIVILYVSVMVIADAQSDEDYMDTLVALLMNADSIPLDVSNENKDESAPVLSDDGLWRCGDCNDLDVSRLIYTEVNEVDNTMVDEENVEIQVGLALPDMRCVTVTVSEDITEVKRVSGSCKGDYVTLTVAPTQRFIVNVYA